MCKVLCCLHYNTKHLACALYIKDSHFCHWEVILCPLPLNVGRFCNWFYQEDTVGVTMLFLSLEALSLKTLNCHIRSQLTLSRYTGETSWHVGTAGCSLSPLQGTGHMSQAIWTLWTWPSDRWLAHIGWYHSGDTMWSQWITNWALHKFLTHTTWVRYNNMLVLFKHCVSGWFVTHIY